MDIIKYVLDQAGKPLVAVDKLTKIDVDLACVRKRNLEFYLSRQAVANYLGVDQEQDLSVPPLKVVAKFMQDKVSQSALSQSALSQSAISQVAKSYAAKPGATNLSLHKPNALHLEIVGLLDLTCNSCGQLLQWPVEIVEKYLLMSEYSEHKQQLELDQGMEVLCPRGRVDLLHLVLQEVGLCVDMVPKHPECR